MPISNVALTNTFNEWRITTNQLIVTINDILNDGGLTTYRSITSNVATSNVSRSNSISSNSIVSNTITSSFVNTNIVNANTVVSNISATFANIRTTYANVVFANVFSSNGGNLVLRTNNLERLRIDPQGNVVVGYDSAPDTITKFHISGSNPTAFPTRGTASNTILYLTNTDSTYGMMFGISSTGRGWIQQQRSDGTDTQYDIVVNPLGGNTAIGNTIPSATLDVVGSISDAKANNLSQTLTDAATITWDGSLGRIATVTLTGNRVVANISNQRVGPYILHVIQDGVGGRTLDFEMGYKFTANVRPPLTSTPNARDIFSFVSDGTRLYGSFIPDVG